MKTSTALLWTFLSGFICFSALAPVTASGQSVPSLRMHPDTLKAFEGYYRFEQNSNAVIQVSAAANGLLAKQLWDLKTFALPQGSAAEFYAKDQGYSIKFLQTIKER